MSRMLKDWTVALFVAAIVFVSVGWWQARPALELAGEAPGFQLNDLDGNAVDLGSYAGSTVVLNFWASWCGPCKTEVPEFVEFAHTHPEVPVLGLAVDSGNEAAVGRAAKRFGITYPVAIADRRTISAYKVSTLPTTVVVGPDGQLKSARIGTMTYDELVRAVD